MAHGREIHERFSQTTHFCHFVTATLPEIAVKAAPVAQMIDEQPACKRRCGLSEGPEDERDENCQRFRGSFR
jgi:hypothetical protein